MSSQNFCEGLWVMHSPLACYADVDKFNIGPALRFGSVDNLSKSVL